MNPLSQQDTPTAQTLDLIAGYRSDGEAIMERLSVEALPDTRDEYRLRQSPAFLRGLASGDRIRFPARNETGYELLRRSGNLVQVLMPQGERLFNKHVLAGGQRLQHVVGV